MPLKGSFYLKPLLKGSHVGKEIAIDMFAVYKFIHFTPMWYNKRISSSRCKIERYSELKPNYHATHQPDEL